jgi:hypothetical protein
MGDYCNISERCIWAQPMNITQKKKKKKKEKKRKKEKMNKSCGLTALKNKKNGEFAKFQLVLQKMSDSDPTIQRSDERPMNSRC